MDKKDEYGYNGEGHWGGGKEFGKSFGTDWAARGRGPSRMGYEPDLKLEHCQVLSPRTFATPPHLL